MKLRRLILTVLLSTFMLAGMAQEKETYVQFETNKGSFTVVLYNETPIHRDNFIKLVNEGAYKNTLFHRVIKGFMCQAAGDIRSKDEAKKEHFRLQYDDTIEAEILYPQFFHKRGALASARVGDGQNPEKRSDAIQFFIVTGQYFLDSDLDKYETPEKGPMPEEVREAYKTQGGAPHLDGQYTIFGEVVDGMKTIEKIERVKTDSQDRPTSDIYIQSAKIVSGD